jgi:hypothetical protein
MLCPHSHLGSVAAATSAYQERTKRNYSRMAPRCSARRHDDLRLTTRLCCEHPRLWLELALDLTVEDSGDVLRAGAESWSKPASISPSRLHSIAPANPCPGWPGIWRLSRRQRPQKAAPSAKKLAPAIV